MRGIVSVLKVSQIDRNPGRAGSRVTGMSTMKNCRVVLILLATVAMLAQSSSVNRVLAQDTQSRGYWIDPSTGLMWAGKDNGRDVSWKKATRYCHDLRLAGYSDWRLATLDELQSVYDRNLDPSGMVGKQKGWTLPDKVKGNIDLTGYEWSSIREPDDRGHPSGYGWYFNFNEGRGTEDQLGYSYGKRALCVRSSGG